MAVRVVMRVRVGMAVVVAFPGGCVCACPWSSAAVSPVAMPSSRPRLQRSPASATRSARTLASAALDTVGPADVTSTPGTPGASGSWNAAGSKVTREAPSSPQRRIPSARSGSPPVSATSTRRWLP